MFRFLRREWRLLEARRALIAGAPERALHDLGDPRQGEHPRVLRLRTRALEGLFHQAAGAAERGRDQSVLRLLGIAERVDPDRARRWRDTLVPYGSASDSSAAGLPGHTRAPSRTGASAGSGPTPVPDPTGSRYLTGILADLRRLRAVAEGPLQPTPEDGARERRGPGARLSPDERQRVLDGRGLRWRMVVDEGGEWLVCDGSGVTLGHARSGRADVPLLAGVDPLHALLERSETFHGGTRWRVRALGGARVSVDGRRLAAEAEELVDGSEVLLGEAVRLRFHAPDPGSGSAVLELLGGLEAEGAQRVLLLSPGPGGRVRVGPYAARHVVVPRTTHEVDLQRELDGPRGQALRVACAGGVRGDGALPPESEAEGLGEVLRVPLPLGGRVDLALGARPDQTFPFGLSLEPLESPQPLTEELP